MTPGMAEIHGDFPSISRGKSEISRVNARLLSPNEPNGTSKQPTFFQFLIPFASSPYSLAHIFLKQ